MKLKTLFSIFFFSLVVSSSAQLLYTDFVPDTTQMTYLEDTTYVIKLDINHDSINDFALSYRKWTTFVSPICCNSGCCGCYYEYITPLDTNSKIGCTDSITSQFQCSKSALDSGLLISNTSLFWKNSARLAYDCQYIDCSVINTKKFIPVKLYADSTYYYGWIRVARFTVYDMAVNLSPNEAVTAAILSTIGIKDVESVSVVDVFPVPFRDEIKVNVNSSEVSELILSDIFSRKILQHSFVGNTTVTTSELAKGVYFYEVRSKNTVLKKGKVLKD
jgi:Secretion system C-terminal sorting domain